MAVKKKTTNSKVEGTKEDLATVENEGGLFDSEQNEEVTEEPTIVKTQSSRAKKAEDVLPPPVQQVQMTPAELAKFVQQQIADALAKDRSERKTMLDTDVIDADDYLDSPDVFFAFSSSWGIYGDKRRGKYVDVPNASKKIRFSPLHRFHNMGRKGVEVISTCKYVSHSKEESRWMREHSLFGIKFFEDEGKASTVSASLAEKMVEQQSIVANMSDAQVIQRAKIENIVIKDANVSGLRKELTVTLANKALKAASESKVQTYVERTSTKKAPEVGVVNESAGNGSQYL